jgi:hypothetical protein
MKCEVASCHRDAAVMVTFKHGSRGWPYCSWHAYDKRGQLRWRMNQVRNVLRGKR